ncbi:ABC transporter ATP-binding protein [Mesorhizobium sp. ANAO-SY3R2]|uniref:ABC transporter ATP-binding protein n=1 Tax=Mesorhizobium sp. ANAO-SY3R2 TaxID=3166644 RepID=UPI00367128D1
MTDAPLVSVRGLAKHYATRGSVLKILENISFDIAKGEVVGLVGESGSGKTTIGRSVLRLIEPSSGEVVFDGTDLTRLSAREMRRQRPRMQYIFQDPFASLSPRMTIGEILTEGLKIQGIGTRAERMERAKKALEQVDLPVDAINRYAHEFSGGQRQRIGIARALTLAPEFIVADEPVSALDVSIQAQVVNLLRELQQRLGLTMLFISHDLAVVEYICDRVIVLYLGRIMEIASAEDLYARPQHPYTQALMSAIPSPDPDVKAERQILKGDIPSPANPPSGCVFRTRCPRALDACAISTPELREVAPGHFKACIRDDLEGSLLPASAAGDVRQVDS